MTINPISLGSIDASAPAPDPLWANVVMLMHFDTSITYDIKGHTVATSGTPAPTLSTSNPKFGAGCGLSSPGNASIHASASSDFAFGTADFCIEFWCRPDNTSSTRAILDMRNNSYLFFPNGATMRIYNNAGALKITSTVTFTQGVWAHVALDGFTSAGNRTVKLYINGAIAGSFVDNTNYTASPDIWMMNGLNNNNFTWIGAIDDLRITKGASRYQGSAFTPPGAPFPNY